ncbi:hypothetical protein [Aestuariibaculum lutulentum]|uniref:DUF4369 domain-containing protein n=1 Tax=Aestuariibaculum lutulentum TaxID=2920935 RepID=A0ABS9RKT7_9FLAO|nr:hypothetical protein [Aestuariibaculum lutulentum]MCH4553555.1 hypothetical protein [Aestuariibaculum lutulentum]
MKFPILVLLGLFNVCVYGQNIEGKFCGKRKKNFMGRVSLCLDFDGKGRFISEIITDIGIVEEGDYQISGNRLILTFDLIDNSEFVRESYILFNVKENESLSFEEYYKGLIGVKIGEREIKEFVILENEKEKLKLKNVKTKKKIKLNKNSS